MTRAVVVINPLSGRGRSERQLVADAALAHEVLASHQIDAWVRPTTAAGDGRRFADQAVQAGCGLVVVWGGDGTVNEVASALLGTGMPMGIVPAGSGNGLAWDLDLPFEPRAALEVAACGETVPIDAGEVNGSAFVNIAGVGIDALIAARFNQRGLRRRGPLAYLQLSVAELVRYRARTYRLTLDGDTFERRAMLIAIANGRQYGNRVLIAPGARLDDGALEVVVVDQLSITGIVRRLPSLFRGTLSPGNGVTMHAARTLRVEASGPIPFHVDGEPREAADQLVVQTRPGALHVRARVRSGAGVPTLRSG